METKDLTIRDVPKDVWESLKREAKRQGLERQYFYRQLLVNAVKAFQRTPATTLTPESTHEEERPL